MHVLLQSVPPALQQATTDPRLHWRLPDTHGHVWVGLLWGHCSFLLGPGAQGSVCACREYFPVLYKFWQLYGGVNGDLLQEDWCHTHTQRPRLCGGPLLTRPPQEMLTPPCLSLCGDPGSWCAQGLFEPSERLWREWGLILNMISPLLPSCWGFSFARGCAVSPHRHSSTYHLTGVSLTLDMRYLLTAGPAKCSHRSWPWTWGISSWPLASPPPCKYKRS